MWRNCGPPSPEGANRLFSDISGFLSDSRASGPMPLNIFPAYLARISGLGWGGLQTDIEACTLARREPSANHVGGPNSASHKIALAKIAVFSDRKVQIAKFAANFVEKLPENRRIEIAAFCFSESRRFEMLKSRIHTMTAGDTTRGQKITSQQLGLV